MIYCDKCGIVGYESHISNNTCPYCSNSMKIVTDDMSKGFVIEPVYGFKKLHDHVREIAVKTSVNYDETTFNERAELEAKIGGKIWERNGAYWKGVYTTPTTPTNVPKCPICGSTRLEKISLTNKIGSVALIGVFAVGHITKTYKCKNCNAKF